MKKLSIALLSVCAINLNLNASAAGGPGGAAPGGATFDQTDTRSGSKPYFPDHDYLKYTPAEMLPSIVQNLHDALINATKHMDRIAKNDDLLWEVSSQSTNANTVNCLLMQNGTVGFDKICQSIYGKLETLKAKTPSALELSELQKEILQAASVVSKALGEVKDGKSK